MTMMKSTFTVLINGQTDAELQNRKLRERLEGSNVSCSPLWQLVQDDQPILITSLLQNLILANLRYRQSNNPTPPPISHIFVIPPHFYGDQEKEKRWEQYLKHCLEVLSKSTSSLPVRLVITRENRSATKLADNLAGGLGVDSIFLTDESMVMYLLDRFVGALATPTLNVPVYIQNPAGDVVDAMQIPNSACAVQVARITGGLVSGNAGLNAAGLSTAGLRPLSHLGISRLVDGNVDGQHFVGENVNASNGMSSSSVISSSSANAEWQERLPFCMLLDTMLLHYERVYRDFQPPVNHNFHDVAGLSNEIVPQSGPVPHFGSMVGNDSMQKSAESMVGSQSFKRFESTIQSNDSLMIRNNSLRNVDSKISTSGSVDMVAGIIEEKKAGLKLPFLGALDVGDAIAGSPKERDRRDEVPESLRGLTTPRGKRNKEDSPVRSAQNESRSIQNEEPKREGRDSLAGKSPARQQRTPRRARASLRRASKVNIASQKIYDRADRIFPGLIVGPLDWLRYKDEINTESQINERIRSVTHCLSICQERADRPEDDFLRKKNGIVEDEDSDPAKSAEAIANFREKFRDISVHHIDIEDDDGSDISAYLEDALLFMHNALVPLFVDYDYEGIYRDPAWQATDINESGNTDGVNDTGMSNSTMKSIEIEEAEEKSASSRRNRVNENLVMVPILSKPASARSKEESQSKPKRRRMSSEEVECNKSGAVVRSRKPNLFLHCRQGCSRSISVACAYLMCVCEIPYDTALWSIKTRRFQAFPNSGFEKQLREFRGFPEIRKRLTDVDVVKGSLVTYFMHQWQKYTTFVDGESRDYFRRMGINVENELGIWRSKQALIQV